MAKLVPPLERVRAELGLSLQEMAATCGCNYSATYNACRGLGAIPRRALEALADLGIDTAGLRAEQTRFMEQRAQAARAELKARLQGEAA